jgi:hypothetical protein
MLNRKVVNGNMIHCKPHVPKSPPTAKPVEETTATTAATATDDKPKEKETGARKKENSNPNQLIPGLPEVLRVKKKRNRKEKKQKNEVNPKKVSDMKATDFLLCTLSGKIISNASNDKTIDDEFVFDEVNDSDAFEDSKEELSDIDDEPAENFLTPINYKSVFGRRLSVSGSVSDLSLKRDRDSPSNKTENKKSRSSSSQPAL